MSGDDHTEPVRVRGASLTPDDLAQLADLLDRFHASSPVLTDPDLDAVETVSRIVNRTLFRVAGSLTDPAVVDPGEYL